MLTAFCVIAPAHSLLSLVDAFYFLTREMRTNAFLPYLQKSSKHDTTIIIKVKDLSPGFGLFDLLPPLFLSYPSALQFHFWVFATIVIKVAHTIHVDRKIQHACHGNPNGVDHHRAQSMCICSWGKFMHVQCVHCVVLVALNHLQFEFLYRIYNVCVWC